MEGTMSFEKAKSKGDKAFGKGLRTGNVQQNGLLLPI